MQKKPSDNWLNFLRLCRESLRKSLGILVKVGWFAAEGLVEGHS